MRTLTFTLAAALAAPALGLAAEPPSTTVSDVVVEATRLPAILADAPDVQVIDRGEIDARQATFAADVLDTVPGLAVTDTGAFGGVTSVRMRGASSDKTLVLIDGVPQNDPSQPAGSYDFANLDLADVQKVEILSGPQGALWGSSAIGGVIAFTTRELDGWRASAEGGSLNTFDGSAGVGRRADSWALGASVSGYRSDGVSKADGLGGPDPYRTWTANAYGRVTPSAAVSLDGHLSYNDSRAATDGYDLNFNFGETPQYATSKSWTGDLRAIVDGPWGFKQTATAGGYWIDRADLGNFDPTSNSRFTASRQDYRWTAERGAPADAFGLIFGAERESIRASLSTGASQGLGTTSGFAVARLRPWTPLTVTGAVRYDAPDTYAGQATGRLAAVLKLAAGFSLEGSWGQGFKTPTISEISCDFCFPAGPSTGLKPEHAEGWDAGLAWRSAGGRISADVTVYRLAVRDQIAFASSFPFRYVNIGHTRTNGVETHLEARLTPHLTLKAGYAYTDALDLDAGTQMLRVPRNAGSVALLWSGGRWDGSFSVRTEGPDADIDPSSFAPARRPGFTLVSLAAAYALTPNLQITGRIENLGDTHYQEVLGYGEPRRMIFVGLKLKG